MRSPLRTSSTLLALVVTGLAVVVPARVSAGPRGVHRGVLAAFTEDSYRAGDQAWLRLGTASSAVTVQIFRCGPERFRTRRNDEMNGFSVTDPISLDWRHYRGRPHNVSLRIGPWPTGMYFARIVTRDGRKGFAPFVLRPRHLGLHRVAVVMPTYTWQAYNFRDDDGDGRPDTWYADRTRRVVRLGRPHLHRGVPMRFRVYDLPFLHWLEWGRRPVDYLAQRDLAGARSGRALRQAYDLIIFPGHHEYVTAREFDLVTTFRNLGGNLMFLSANNFFWRVDRRGRELHRIAMWRDLGRPEAALVGVQYVSYDSHRRGPYIVREAGHASGVFHGMGVRNGSRFGTFGIEIDKTTPMSPPKTTVLAEIPNLYGRGMTAQMTYYRTPAGAKVFAAGAFTLAGSATRSYGRRLLDNLWRHMTRG